MTDYKASKRIVGTASEIPSIYSGKSWVELGRKSVPSTTKTWNTDDFTSAGYDNLMILFEWKTNQTNADSAIRFNSNSGTHYAYRNTYDGSGSNSNTSKDEVMLDGTISGMQNFTVLHVTNIADKEKMGHYRVVHEKASGSGSGEVPRRAEGSLKWSNTSDNITSLYFDNVQSSGTRQYTEGEVVILGQKSTGVDASGKWQELGDVSGNGSSTSLDVSFTAKKYLWVQIHTTSASGHGGSLTFNDTGNDEYAMRRNEENTEYDNKYDMDYLRLNNSGSAKERWVNMFIINKSNEPKLATYEVCESITDGEGTAPTRMEAVGKWNNNAQITKITLGTATFDSTTTMKVWGFD